jgi:hypothetical protein
MADLISMLAACGATEGEPTDPDFNQTVLLLHGDGTNGAQNNTFLDGSTNNFTITRNGNTTQGTFSPFSVGAGEWSNYFDGNDYLSVPDSAALELGSGDFTIECWFYPLANAYNSLVTKDAPSGTRSWGWVAWDHNSSGTLKTVFFIPAGAQVNGTAALNINAWNFLTVTRSGNTMYLGVNGSVSSHAWTSTIPDGTTAIFIGAQNGPGGISSYTNGYLSNVRLVVGQSVSAYQSTFTPPTIPATQTSGSITASNTKILTCQSNRFVDNAATPNTLTVVGPPRVTPFSPFAPSAAYDPAVNGGSGYFDGSGDYLSIADAAGLRFGTGNFTIQAWIYRSAAGAVHSIAAKGGASTGWVFQVHSDNKLRFTQTTTNIDSTGTIPAGAWTHVAVVREGTGTNQTKLYINGVNDGQATVTTDFNQTEQLNIGADRGNANPMNGYIAGFKYVVGTAETITVPTAPPTGGTALLNFTNAGIFDSTGKNNLETVGDAQIDTTTKKYGTGSMEFDGTGDWLLMANTPDQQLGTGNFTIEFWVYLATGDIGSARGLVAKGTSTTGFLVSLNTTEKVVFTFASSTITSTGAITTNAWNHIAVVREGTGSNLTKIYINGTNDGTGTVSTDFNQTSVMYVGCNRTAGDPMKGFIDDLRITKGVARYTANFTPPTAAFPNE